MFITLIKRVVPLSIQFIKMIYYYIRFIFYKDKTKFKDAWIICERGNEAKDNGYFFFRYLKEEKPQVNAFYVIDTKYKSEYQKVKDYHSIIEYHSYEHKMASFCCKNFISTHTGYVIPWSYPLFNLLFNRRKKIHYIFLQHGVIYNDLSKSINKFSTGIDLFITSSNKERESIISNQAYGFKEDEVVLTGLARFDSLMKEKNKQKKTILYMPTWRSNLSAIIHSKEKDTKENEVQKFKESKYYKAIHHFLVNPTLFAMLEENDIDLIFYPHYEMQRYLDLFQASKHIHLARKDMYDVHELLKDASLLITDYSSVFMDFGLLEKPMVYYQFDKDEFYKNHYTDHGYFQIEENGFGEVVVKEDELLKCINNIIQHNFKMDKVYRKKVHDFFVYFDTNNCNRIYDAILYLDHKK